MNPPEITKQADAIPIGTIANVHGPVVEIACDRLPSLRQALCSHINNETYLFEVHQHLDERHVRAITLHRTAGLSRGMPVYDTGSPLHVPVAPECLGRLLNIFGEPLDGGEPLPQKEFRNIHGHPAQLCQALPIGLAWMSRRTRYRSRWRAAQARSALARNPVSWQPAAGTWHWAGERRRTCNPQPLHPAPPSVRALPQRCA